jgi:TonB family protein
MLRLNVHLIIRIVFSASFFACQAEPFQDPEMAAQRSPSVALQPNPASLELEFHRAIDVLKRGLAENWRTRGQYLSAFEKTPNTDSVGRPVAKEKEYVECSIRAHLRVHENWDEGPPIEVEVNRTIVDFTQWRNEAEQATRTRAGFSNQERQPTDFYLPPPCTAPRKVAISSGVAASLLKTRIDPVYPVAALKNHVYGTVVLEAAINTDGRVESLRLISGPPSLQQAALDAVRRWVYHPYLLNNVPVEVRTTINVVFAPSR